MVVRASTSIKLFVNHQIISSYAASARIAIINSFLAMKRCPSGLKLSDTFTISKQSDSALERNLKEMDATKN